MGFTPKSGREHPPAPKPGGGGAGGTQCGSEGPMTNHGGGYGAGGKVSNAVERTRPPLKGR
jgi:hypothetical protein